MASSNLPVRTGAARPPARTTYLAQSIKLEEGTSPILVQSMVVLIAITLVAAVAWSMMARLDQVARADGQVIPSSAVRTLQHLEGGIIESIHVEEGDIVETGASLVTMSPTFAESELAQLRVREASLAVRLARLQALVSDGDPVYGAFSISHPQLVTEQNALLNARRNARANQLDVLRRQVRERELSLQTLQGQRDTVQRSVDLLEEEAKLRKQLLDKGLTPRFRYLDLLRSVNTTRGQLLQVEGLIERARESVSEAESKLAEVESKLENDSLTEIAAVSTELTEVRESLARFVDRVERLELTAPVRGIVQTLRYKSTGGVITPGETVVELVPLDDKLVVEVQLNPKDIGFVSVGQEANVRFTAYDYAQFGGVSGTVDTISATTVLNPNGTPYYEVVLSLEKPFVGQNPQRNLILPGMVVQADIRTGERTLFQYLTKPINRAFQLGLVEP